MISRQLLARYASLRRDYGSRLGFLALSLAYLGLVLACLAGFAASGEPRPGGLPAPTVVGTAGEVAPPGFLDLWFGGPAAAAHRADVAYLGGLAAAAWTTFSIATLGSLLGALMALPLGLLAARPGALRRPVGGLLAVARSIHSLIFGLLLVGLVGVGPGAGLLALALHSAGRYGQALGALIDQLDRTAIDAVRSVGASSPQVFFTAVWPSVLPQFAACHLELWVFNLRDATILGLVGAGGLGLLIGEATAALQWGRLAAALLVVVLLVGGFDALCRRLRQALS